MNKKIILFSFLLLMLSFNLFSFAEEAENVLPDPGVLPGSIIYPFKILGENIKTLFTFGSEAKAERHQFLSSLRLSELEAVTEKGIVRKIEKASERYQNQQETLNRLMIRIGAGEELINKLSNNIDQHLDILEILNEQVPEEAKMKLEDARSILRRGKIETIEIKGEDNLEEALIAYQEIINNRLNSLKTEIGENDESKAMLVLSDWEDYNEGLRQFQNQKEIEANQWQFEAINQMDELDADSLEMPKLRERLWEARLEAVNAQVESLQRRREQNQWTEAQGDFAQAALGRIEQLQKQVRNMEEECRNDEECLSLHQKLIDALSLEYERYALLGEELMQESDSDSDFDGEDREALMQVGQKAVEAIEQIYEMAPQEAKDGLDQALISSERLRQLSQQRIQASQELLPVSEVPAIQRIQNQVREELNKQIEESAQIQSQNRIEKQESTGTSGANSSKGNQ